MTFAGPSAQPTDWVPAACSLPTADRPVRVAEFDRLFRESVREIDRVSPERLRLLLEPSAAEFARELTTREAGCCSFFEFTITAADDAVELAVSVPPAHVPVMDSLQRRAASAAGARE